MFKRLFIMLAVWIGLQLASAKAVIFASNHREGKCLCKIHTIQEAQFFQQSKEWMVGWSILAEQKSDKF